MENSSAYLFPFIVEYSIIGSHVLYSMWRNIGKNPEYLMLGDDSTEDEHTGWPIRIILFVYLLSYCWKLDNEILGVTSLKHNQHFRIVFPKGITKFLFFQNLFKNHDDRTDL